MNATPILELKNISLTTSIGLDYLLKDISFTIDKSDRIAIIGPSGAGKTTLLRLLNRLNEPTQGQIFYNNQSLKQIPIISLRQQIVLVPQEPKLLGMTVQQTLAYPLVLQKRSKTEILERIETCINRLSIPFEWLERHELQLSLGQRQLVAIARALIMQPQILLLDEPTSALDLGTANHLMNIFKKLTKEQMMTVLIVNHQLEIIESFAQKVFYLQKGQIKKIMEGSKIDWQELRNTLIIEQQNRNDEWGADSPTM